MSREDTRFGRRGAALVLFAFVSLVYGFAVAGSDPPRPGLEPITRIVELPTLAFCWIFSGVIAIALSILRRSWLGYVVLMPMPIAWAGSYTVSFILQATGTHEGSSTAWAGALVWGLLVGLLGIITGWPEPPISKGAKT